jgi:DNA-binding GntR family transcriptional regulator
LYPNFKYHINLRHDLDQIDGSFFQDLSAFLPRPKEDQVQQAVTSKYRSLTQIIVEALRNSIFEGEYEPGDRLNMADLAQEFSTSAVPVREALRNLEAEGLVHFQLNKGVTVRKLSGAEVCELFLIRLPLEELAGSEAARLATPEKIAPLRELINKMASCMGQEKWHRLHAQFHRELYAISKLPRLVQLIDTLRGQMQAYSKIYLTNMTHLELAHQEHCSMVQFLEQHDVHGITKIMYEHLARPARMAIAVIGEDISF